VNEKVESVPNMEPRMAEEWLVGFAGVWNFVHEPSGGVFGSTLDLCGWSRSLDPHEERIWTVYRRYWCVSRTGRLYLSVLFFS
jgi:hypothetical protein